jgi:hypothetical protein
VQQSIGGIPFRVVGDIGEAGAGFAADVDHDGIEIFARRMVPQTQFADATKAVDPQGRTFLVGTLISHAALLLR